MATERVGFKTTLLPDLIIKLKVEAAGRQCGVNDILEALIIKHYETPTIKEKPLNERIEAAERRDNFINSISSPEEAKKLKPKDGIPDLRKPKDRR